MSRRINALLALLLLACGGTAQKAPPKQAEQDHDAQHEDKSSEPHGPLGHRFEDAEKWARRFDDPAREAWQKPAEVVGLMQIEAGMTVADIGAGTGYFLPSLSRAAGKRGSVLGLDIEKDMVRYMTERAEREGLPNVTARVVATDDPGLDPASVDRVLIVNTWHHIEKRVAYAKKLIAGMRPGSELMIVDFTMESERGPPKAHRLTADAILDELEAAGLGAQLLDESLPDQFIIVATRP